MEILSSEDMLVMLLSMHRINSFQTILSISHASLFRNLISSCAHTHTHTG